MPVMVLLHVVVVCVVLGSLNLIAISVLVYFDDVNRACDDVLSLHITVTILHVYLCFGIVTPWIPLAKV
jgi:hypothetical protein